MTAMTLMRPDQWQPAPWKNGQGQTVQLAIDPADASLESGIFNWRVSMATISKPGPFSRFAGYDRVLTQIGGGRIELGRGESARLRFLEPFKPHFFEGERALYCQVGAPAIDINAMVKRSWGSVKMSVMALTQNSSELRTTATCFHLFCVGNGAIVTADDGRKVALRHNEFASSRSASLKPGSLVEQAYSLQPEKGGCKMVITEFFRKVEA